MSRWVNWWWRAIEMSPDDRQMNPGETRRLQAENPLRPPEKKTTYQIVEV
jgi:hypothetical protein